MSVYDEELNLSQRTGDICTSIGIEFKEYKTTEYIKSVLTDLNINHYQILDTGVIGVLEGSSEITLGFRADIDALPVQEQNDVPYKVLQTMSCMRAARRAYDCPPLIR